MKMAMTVSPCVIIQCFVWAQVASRRLILHCAAYVLHQQLRVHALVHTELAAAQPMTVILKLFKVATQIKQCKDRVILHLPSACPFKQLLHTITERMFLVKTSAANSS